MLRTLLFGVSEMDPATFLGVVGLLVAVTIAACYLPVRAASRIDPMAVLREE